MYTDVIFQFSTSWRWMALACLPSSTSHWMYIYFVFELSAPSSSTTGVCYLVVHISFLRLCWLLVLLVCVLHCVGFAFLSSVRSDVSYLCLTWSTCPLHLKSINVMNFHRLITLYCSFSNSFFCQSCSQYYVNFCWKLIRSISFTF